jgi:lipopolysaccharide export LptBFGC system permease protein LptF
MMGIALATALGFSYWILLSASVTLGKNNVLPAYLAAWLPNAAFLGSAIFFFRRMG